MLAISTRRVKPGNADTIAFLQALNAGADGRDVLADPTTHSGVRIAAEAGLRIEFIWAQRGLLDEEQGLYDEQRVAALQLTRNVAVTAVRDINHYSVIFEPAGTVAIGDAVARVLQA